MCQPFSTANLTPSVNVSPGATADRSAISSSFTSRLPRGTAESWGASAATRARARSDMTGPEDSTSPRGYHPGLDRPMASRKRFSVLRDPVHGDIYLTHEEIAVIDTPEMQRLRGVKQLGTAYLVFPGAVHTRFDHSIGALHMAQRVIDAVNLSSELDPAACIGIGPEEARVVRIAALVHDATHVPFG